MSREDATFIGIVSGVILLVILIFGFVSFLKETQRENEAIRNRQPRLLSERRAPILIRRGGTRRSPQGQ